jgi:hypothetical protein
MHLESIQQGNLKLSFLALKLPESLTVFISENEISGSAISLGNYFLKGERGRHNVYLEPAKGTKSYQLNPFDD